MTQPAFPTSEANNDGSLQEPCSTGMSLLDYFAAAALTGTLAHPECSGTYEDCAKQAYTFAREMMKERDK